MSSGFLGIVTRCPLVLRLKKHGNEGEWKGKVSFLDREIEISDASRVEKEISEGKCPMFVFHCLFEYLVNQVK